MSKERRRERLTGRSGSPSTSSSTFPVAARRRRNSVEVNIELLLGTQVRDVNGDKVGRIQELRVDSRENSCVVESYLIGASALIERLSAWTLVRPIARLLHARHLYRLYDVSWQEM